MSEKVRNPFHRAVYFNRIAPFIGKQIIKILVGQRRVGKSCVLYDLMLQIRKMDKNANIIYINKESIEFDEITNYRELNDFVVAKLKKAAKNYIFIDEIQTIKDFHIAIKSFVLDSDNDIYITGSNSNMLSSDLANELGGRYVEFVIHGLSYNEFLLFNELENNVENLDRYMHYGGLPYLLHLPNEEIIITEYLKNIYNSIVLKDIIQKNNIRNSIFLEQLIKFLASTTGKLFSARSISDYLKHQQIKIGVQQIIEYTNAISKAFVMDKVSRYDIVGKKIFEVGEKYYFEDTGIRNSLVGYRTQDKEKMLENVVYHHLVTCNYDVKIGYIGTKEVDFIATKNNEKRYIQVALELSREDTIEREFGNLMLINDHYPKFVITAEKSHVSSFEGIQHIYIGAFLTTEL
jgi:predicted AAA+ superfamily ATPase